jgi:hypothetical protein
LTLEWRDISEVDNKHELHNTDEHQLILYGVTAEEKDTNDDEEFPEEIKAGKGGLIEIINGERVIESSILILIIFILHDIKFGTELEEDE